MRPRFDAVLFDAGGVLVLPDPTVLGPLLAPFGGDLSIEAHRRAMPDDPWLALLVDPYYRQRWLAGQQPVMARGKDTRLRVIVQESYDALIGQPLTDLRSGLILLSLATLLLSAAVIIPLWTLILRLVR